MSGHYHTVNMTTLFRTVRAITRRVARRSGAIYSSLQSMAELDEISCVQIQFLPHAPRAIRFFKPEYGCMPTEKLSINRMRVLGAFPAVLDDLNFKFSRVRACPRTQRSTIQFTQKKGYKQDYRQIASPFIRI